MVRSSTHVKEPLNHSLDIPVTAFREILVLVARLTCPTINHQGSQNLLDFITDLCLGVVAD